MEREDFPHEGVLFDDRVVDALVHSDWIDISRDTEELNDGLRTQTGSYNLIPVVTGNSYEDIAKWSMEIESPELDDWLNYQYYLDFRGNAGGSPEGELTQSAIVGVFCTDVNNRTYLGEHFIKYLKNASTVQQRMMYGDIKLTVVDECDKSLGEFYTTLEDIGLVTILAYDDEYPFNKKIRALYAAAEKVLQDAEIVHLGHGIGGAIVTCLALVSVGDSKDHVDYIVAARCAQTFRYRGLECSSRTLLSILDEIDKITESNQQLLDYFKDSIIDAVRILEEVYGLNLEEIMLADERRKKYSTYFVLRELP